MANNLPLLFDGSLSPEDFVDKITEATEDAFRRTTVPTQVFVKTYNVQFVCNRITNDVHLAFVTVLV